MPSSPLTLTDAPLEQRVKGVLVDMLGLRGSNLDETLARLAGDALIDINSVGTLTGLSGSNIYRRIKDAGDLFPRPIRVDGRSLWLLSEVRRWIEMQVTSYRTQKVAA